MINEENEKNCCCHDDDCCCGHEGEEHECCHDDDCCCGHEDHDCCEGGCHCGCHHEPIIEGPNAGKTVVTHYRGTFNDGTVFDSSYEANDPLEFICGVGMMIPGFDKAVVDMKVGEKRSIHLMPEEAYGMPDPEAVFTVELEKLHGGENLKVGDRIHLTNSEGQTFPVMVAAKDEKSITFDANHEMAGKELNFEIELIEVRE